MIVPETEKLEQPYPRPLSDAQVTKRPSTLVPAHRPLEGRYVRLEPQDAVRDAQALYDASHGNDEALHIWDFLTYGPWPSIDEYMAVLRQQSASADPMFYTIRSLEAGSACGQSSYLDIRAQDGVIEIAHIWIEPALQRTRVATEATYLMLCHAMDDLGYRRVQWRCNSFNKKSRQAARRLGFRFEGIFYNHEISKGKNRDTAWYSILDDEWPEVRRIIGNWLDRSNFGSDGRAKASLSRLMKNRSPSTRVAEYIGETLV